MSLLSFAISRLFLQQFTLIPRVRFEPADNIDDDASTPLYIASRYGHFDVVKSLLDAGAELEG